MIYLVEDDDSIRGFVIYTLNSQGMPAQGFATPSAFWQAMNSSCPTSCCSTSCCRRRTGCTF